MGKLTTTVGIGQSAWDSLFDTTTKDSDDLTEGSTNKFMTAAESTKLASVEDNASADQTGTEIQTAIMTQTWDDRRIVTTDPATGEHQIKGIHRNAAGELEYDYEETAES